MAAALFNARAARSGEAGDWVARSAGTWGLDDQPASAHAVTALAERGVDLTRHRAHTIEQEDLDQADVVVVMTRSHRDALAAEFPASRKKLHLMSELRGQIFDISDPYGGTLAEYQDCAQGLQALIDQGYNTIKAWVHGDSN
jgi:protein-tyrosine-phosphatase